MFAYAPSRNYGSYNRLNYNHWILKDMCGYMLHPEIRLPAEEEACIADIGAGNGVWLFETAVTVPKNVKLDGFDASSIHFPPESLWPKNVRLITQDTLQPFPELYHNKYDVVHIRHTGHLVTDDDINSLLMNVLPLLKPNGYVQLIARCIDSINMVVSKPPTQQPTPLLAKTLTDSSYNWLQNSSPYFEQFGLSLTIRTEYVMKDHLKLMWAQNNLTSSYESIGRKSSNRYNTMLGQAMAQLYDESNKHSGDAPPSDSSWVCIVARRTS